MLMVSGDDGSLPQSLVPALARDVTGGVDLRREGDRGLDRDAESELFPGEQRGGGDKDAAEAAAAAAGPLRRAQQHRRHRRERGLSERRRCGGQDGPLRRLRRPRLVAKPREISSGLHKSGFRL